MSELEIIQRLDEIRNLTLLQTKTIFNAEEAVIYMGISKSYLYKLCQKGLIEHFVSKGGKNLYFRKQDLNKWMLHSKVKTKSEIEAEASRIAARIAGN